MCAFVSVIARPIINTYVYAYSQFLTGYSFLELFPVWLVTKR